MARHLLVVGAHPDDPDICAGGLACLAAAEHRVRFVSATDGRSGHHEQRGVELADRRRAEANAAADVAGIEYEVLDNADGELRPTLERRKRLIRLFREFEPDAVLTHRPNDYHPDHRYTAQLVRDAAYMVTVPNVCPDVPALDDNPVFAYVLDGFERPYPFDPDVFVPLDGATLSRKYDMLHCHESQMYEWLPHNKGDPEAVPEGADERRAWLESDPFPSLQERRAAASRFRDRLVDRFGPERGRDIDYVEAFEVSEYGGPLTPALREDLFSY